MCNPELDAVREELSHFGIKPSVEDDGPHAKVRWWHAGRPRVVVCAKTGSDWRGPANARALTRRLLREDGHDVAAAPAPRPRVALLEKALAAPAPVDTTPERLSRLEAEQRYVTDLLLQIAPSFDAILSDQAPPQAKPIGYRLILELPPAKLGLVLAAVYSMGLKPSEVDVLPLGVEEPAPAKAKANGAHAPRLPKGGRVADRINNIVAAIKDHGPCTTAELRKVLCVPREQANAFQISMTQAKKRGLITPGTHNGSPWNLATNQGAS
jgi:hypothetical protein